MSRFPHFAIAVALAVAGTVFQTGTARAQQDIEPQQPTGHFRIERPAGLSGADALTVYTRILDDMVAGYRLSGEAYADSYRLWRRFNTVPYRSAQHGQRFINNYANDVAKAYRRYEDSGPMPVGSILVKDSFAVTKNGDVFSGPLFVMEKMPAGFEPRARDWRYTMIMPDGSLFGTTHGEGSNRVEFCIDCHELVGDEQDHMFYVPEEFRVRFLN